MASPSSLLQSSASSSVRGRIVPLSSSSHRIASSPTPTNKSGSGISGELEQMSVATPPPSAAPGTNSVSRTSNVMITTAGTSTAGSSPSSPSGTHHAVACSVNATCFSGTYVVDPAESLIATGPPPLSSASSASPSSTPCKLEQLDRMTGLESPPLHPSAPSLTTDPASGKSFASYLPQHQTHQNIEQGVQHQPSFQLEQHRLFLQQYPPHAAIAPPTTNEPLPVSSRPHVFLNALQQSTTASHGYNNNSVDVTPASPGGTDLRRQLCDQNVFVFHLPSEWTEDDLRREFEPCGEILSAKVVQRPDGTSKGYGFVCFYENAAACRAVEAMNGRSVGGKRLKVSLKKTPEECLNLQLQRLMELSQGNQPYDKFRDCTLFVFHLPASWDENTIRKHFQSFGNIVCAKVAKKDNSLSRGYGFVTFEAPYEAALAIASMNGVEVGQNKRLKVQLKQQSSSPHPIPGCTIFIFHLPNDWRDTHLRQHFSHCGKILGATIQRDASGASKGYGFVSFDRPQSALNAVIGMNGFCVGRKRLKVSLKKGDAGDYNKMPQPATYVHSATHTPTVGYWDMAGITAEFGVVSPSSSVSSVLHQTPSQEVSMANTTRTAIHSSAALRGGSTAVGAPLDNAVFATRTPYSASTGPAINATVGAAVVPQRGSGALQTCPTTSAQHLSCYTHSGVSDISNFNSPTNAGHVAYQHSHATPSSVSSFQPSSTTPTYPSYLLSWTNG